MERPGLTVLAYHGCDRSVRDDLLAPGRSVISVKDSKNPYDWLGTGAYFFEDDWMRALYFAQVAFDSRALTKGTIKEPAVVGAVIRIHRWLDMCTSEGRQEYVEAVDSLQERGTSLRSNKPSDHQLDEFDILRHLDRQVINHIHRLRMEQDLPAYDAVRSYFPQGQSLTGNSAFLESSHVQIALRKPECVLGYFRVREAEVQVEDN